MNLNALNLNTSNKFLNKPINRSLVQPLNMPNFKGLNFNQTLKLNSSNAFDSVSFTAKFTPLAKTVESGKNLGVEIYNQAIKSNNNFNPAELIEKSASDLEVLPIEELSNLIEDSSDYCAFYTANLGKDYIDYDHKIYVNTKIPNNKDKALIYAMDTGHEYTHYRQSKEGEEAEILKEFSSDWDYYAMIPAVCGLIFKPFDSNLQANFVKDVFMNMQDMQSIQKYGRFLPNKHNVSKDELLRMNGMKNEKEFQDKMNQIFDETFIQVIKFIVQNPHRFDDTLNNSIRKIVKEGNLETLIKDMRKYCSYCAHKEKEAYKTEVEIAREILKTRKPLNLDAFCLYYEMLEEAFKNGRSE